MWEGGRDRSWENEGGNKRESRDGASKVEYSMSREVKASGRERKREKGQEGRTKVESNIRKLIQLSGKRGR